MGCNLYSILDDAKLTPHEQILTFDELRLEVLHEIMHPDKYVGTPMPSLPMVTSKIKGLRRGELTVLTGPTGSGYVQALQCHAFVWRTEDDLLTWFFLFCSAVLR